MGKFSKIKKYNLNSLSIDEKIKFLDKEMEKTGLNEQPANSTSSVYSQNETQPNTAHTNFTSSSFNNLPLGFSGHDGSGVGGAYVGKVIASEHGLTVGVHDHILNLNGVAVSPPHPVSGRRVYASTRTGMVSFSPTQPGKVQGNSDYPTGSVMWIWNPTANNSDGTSGAWYPLEFDVSTQAWGFWDTNFLGFGFLNTDLSQLEFTPGDSTGTALNTLLTNNGLNNQDMGQPSTIVLNTKSLESADNLPIDVAKKFIAGMLDLAGEGFNFLLARGTSGNLDTVLDFLANITGTSAEKDNVDDYTRNFIPDLAAGKEPTGSTPDNPRDNSGVYDAKTISDYEKIFQDWQRETNGEKDSLENSWETNYDLIQRDNNSIGNTTGTLDPSAGDGFIDNGDGTVTLRKAFDFDRYDDMAGSNLATTLGAMTYGIMSGIPGLLIKSGGKTPTMYTGITFNKKTGKVIPNYKSKSIKESLDESVKLGHFDPEALTVDIEDIRKGIMPEFPKKPPAEMIDGYSVKSKLAPKVIKGEPTIKVRKKDLAALHILKDSEIKELLQQIDLINDYLQKNPADLIYAQQRYPKNDIRLAQLNWKMDQMLDAGEEYLDTQFPENQRLVDRIKKATKKTMELTNPEAYKNLNKPDMELMSLDDHMKEKRVVSRHFKKKRQSKSMFRVDMEKVKEKNRKVAEQKIAEWQEKRRIELLNSNEFDELKSDWKKELGEGMTTQVLTGILPSTGDADLEVLQTGLTGNGDIDYGQPGVGDETMEGEGEYTCFTNLDDLQNVNDPNNIGTYLRIFDQETKEFRGGSHALVTGGNDGYNQVIPGYKSGMVRNVKPSGDYNAYDKSRRIRDGLPLTQNGSDLYYHLYGPTNDVLGLGYGSWNSTDGVTATRTGTRLDFNGPGSPRFAALKAIDSTGFDTIKIHALLGDDDIVSTYRDSEHQGGTLRDKRVQIYYWAGDHKDYVRHPSASHVSGYGHLDGWRPINLKPNGEVDPDVDPYIIKHTADRPSSAIDANGVPYSTNNKLAPYSIPLPDYTRSKNARYMIVQADKTNIPTDAFSVLSVRFQRRSNVKTPALTKPLTDIETSPFVRVGPTKKNEGGKQRKKKVQDIIRSGLKYTAKKFSKDFPVRTDLE